MNNNASSAVQAVYDTANKCAGDVAYDATLPDLALSFEKLKIVCDLMAITNDSVFADAIRMSVNDNPSSVIEMILSQARDNESLVANIVGRDLLTRIQKVFV